MVKAVKQVDVVISVVRGNAIPDQVKIIEAIKEAGDIKVLNLLNDSFLSMQLTSN